MTEVEKQKQGVVPDRWSLVRERVMKLESNDYTLTLDYYKCVSN